MARDGSFLAGLIVGALAGVIAGLLLTPKAGKETRKIIRDKGGEYVSNFRDKLRRCKSGEEIKETVGPSQSPSNSTQPVDAVSGIGTALRGRLESGGIRNVGDLANAPSSEVARLLETTEEQAMKFIIAARDMTGSED
jgi:gas vesicle protein